MRSVVAIGKKVTGHARRAAGGVLAVGILLAVPALGLMHLGSDLLASWQGRNAELVSAGNSLEGVLAFDGPAATAAQHQARTSDSSSPTGQPTKLALLLDEWRFTQQPTDYVSIINGFEQDVTLGEVGSDMILLKTGTPAQAVLYMANQQLLLNKMGTQTLLAVAQSFLNPTSPTQFISLINQFQQNASMGEIFSDMLALRLGVPAEAVVTMAFQQILFNEVVTQDALRIAATFLPPTPPTPASPCY